MKEIILKLRTCAAISTATKIAENLKSKTLLFKNKNTILAYFLSYLFCLSQILGKYFSGSLAIGKYEFAFAIFCAILPAFFFAEFLLRLKNLHLELFARNPTSTERNQITFREDDLKYFSKCSIFMFATWIPVFLAYFPGLFAYDVMGQIPQRIGSYNTHHPLFHTLFLQFFYFMVGKKIFDNYSIGIAFATIFQMSIFSAMLATIHLLLRRFNVKKIVRIFVLAIFSFLPFFSVLAISHTKDIFFAGFVAMFAVCLVYWQFCPKIYQKQSNIFLYIFSIVGIILLRNNGIFAIVIAALVGMIYFAKQKKMRFVVYTGFAIFLAMLCFFGIKKILHASDGSKNEALSIPYQQLAFVYKVKNQNLLLAEKSEILEIIPNVQNYDPHRSDSIKGYARGWANKKQFINLWLKYFLRYPLHYVEAFLQHNLGYFYIFDISHAQIYGIVNRQGYLLTDTKSGFDVEHISFFPPLEKLYEFLFTSNNYQYAPFLQIVFSPAFYFWYIIILISYAIESKSKAHILISFLTTLILTYLAGPCVLIRYAFPFIVCIPSLWVAVFYRLK